MKKKLVVPKFKNEDEEREFWWNVDLSEYFEVSDLEEISFPNLKPSGRPIPNRISEHLLKRLKQKVGRITP